MDLLGFKGGDQYLLGEKKEQYRKAKNFLKNVQKKSAEKDLQQWEHPDAMIDINTPTAQVETGPMVSLRDTTPQLPANFQGQNTTATAPNYGRNRVGFISSLFGN